MGSQLLIYIVKRLLVMIPTLFVIALICFVVLNLAPGRPGQAGEAAQASGSEEARNQRRIFRETFNLDKPVLFNTYFWIEKDEVAELIADSLDPGATAAERVDARYKLEDYGNYIVPELIELLNSSDDPGVRAFIVNQLALNGAMRNLFLGAEDEIPQEIGDAQREISRHNNRIREWDVPPNWTQVPEGYATVWPLDEATCPRPAQLEAGFCATDAASGASIVVGRLPLDSREITAAEVTGKLGLGEPGEVKSTGSADRVQGELFVYEGEATSREVGVFVPPEPTLLEEGQSPPEPHAVIMFATAPSEVFAQQRTSFERAASGLETGFGALLEQRTAAWNQWFEDSADRFDLSTGEKISAFFSDTRFFKYMGNLLSGDFGFTIKKRPVLPEILQRLKYSFVLSMLSVFLIYLLAIPIGIFSAIRQHTFGDQVITVMLFILYSLPTFFVGTLIVQYTPESLPFATSGFETNPVKEPYLNTGARLWDICLHLVFPVITLTYGGLAALSRYARTGLLDVIRADYIRTARAKGLSETVVILKHAVRNGMIPILTILGTLLPVLFGGSIVVEYIFEIDGIGRYMFQAIQLRDYTVIMGILLISAVMTLVGLLISDISYALVDPRITFD